MFRYILAQTTSGSIKAFCGKCWENYLEDKDRIILEEDDPFIVRKVVRTLMLADILWYPCHNQCPHVWVALDPLDRHQLDRRLS